MSDNDPSAADPFGQIADEFVEAFRQGKRPSVEEFARRYPEHADEIREILPALVLMEKAKVSVAPGQLYPAQALGLGLLGSLADAREVVRRSFELRTYDPGDRRGRDEAHERFTRLVG